MALPDYSQYQTYKPYRQAVGRDAISRKSFRKGRDAYVPPAPPVPAQQPMPFQPLPSRGEGTPNTAQHPFFDPSVSYGTNPGQQQSMTPGTLPYMFYGTEQSPEGYYYAAMNERGFGGLDAKSQAAQNMYRDYARGYQAAKLKNQELWFPQYMEMQDVEGTVRGLSNRQLGIDENLYAGRDRWSLRGY